MGAQEVSLTIGGPLSSPQLQYLPNAGVLTFGPARFREIGRAHV